MRSPAYYVTLLLLACTSEATFAADAEHGATLAHVGAHPATLYQVLSV